MSQRFLLLQVADSRADHHQVDRSMAELRQLVETFGGEVVSSSIQHRPHPDQRTYIGAGKVEWLKEQITEHEIDVIVLNAVVKAGQIFTLERSLWEVNSRIAVWDRVGLILNIFEQHATTTEAKLQIDLARLEYLGPRAYGLGKDRLSRQGGGIGTRGLGETNIEIERRNAKKIKQRIQQQLEHRSAEQQKRIAQRVKLGIQTMALVGYTSAGKTSFFNALTAKQKQTHQGLFTTLDSTVGKIKLTKYAPTVLISDTIGFIDDLPTFLVQAFKSTLFEALYAQILFHVVDASDPEMMDKIAVVNKILAELKISTVPIYIFNKVDLITTEQQQTIAAQFADQRHFFISAKTGEGLDQVKGFMNLRFHLETENL